MIKRYKILKPIMLSFSLARDQSDVLHAKGYLDADDATIWFVRRARLSDGLPHHQQGREETISSVAMLEWWLRDGALEEINMDVGPRTEKQDAQALTVALREANAVISDKAAAVERLKLELATARAWFEEQQKLVVDQRAKINALEHDNTHGAKALGERLEAVMNERDKERAVVAELIRERNLLASEAAGLHRNHKLMADQLDGYDALKDAYKRVVDQLAESANEVSRLRGALAKAIDCGPDSVCGTVGEQCQKCLRWMFHREVDRNNHLTPERHRTTGTMAGKVEVDDDFDAEVQIEALSGAEVRNWQRKNVEAAPAPDHHNARRLAWREYAVSSSYTAHPPDRINMADALLTAEEARFGEVK